MSMTHAQKAILQAIQKKQNCNLVQERKYDDYGDYNDVHGDYYDFDHPYSSEGECHGDYGDVHGDYYDMDIQVDLSEGECYDDYGDVHGDYYDFECGVVLPDENILERIKNRLFQKTK